MGQLGPGAEPAVGALINGLAEGGVAKPGVGVLIEYDPFPESPYGTVRAACAQALGQIGPPAKAAMPGLARLARGTNVDAQIKAIIALRRINPQLTNTVPLLLDALQTLDGSESGGEYHLELLKTVIGMSLRAHEATPLLLEATKRQHPPLRAFAAESLKRLDPEAVAGAGVK